MPSLAIVPGRDVLLAFEFPDSSEYGRVDGRLVLKWSTDASETTVSPEPRTGRLHSLDELQSQLTSAENDRQKGWIEFGSKPDTVPLRLPENAVVLKNIDSPW
jgi:hypothetical protein